MNLNGLNSFLIFPGQQLKVSGSVSSNSHSSYNSNSGGSSSTYTVRYGDSLSSIASRYGTTYQHIMRLNGLNNFFIYPGQKLRVSGSASSNTYSTRSDNQRIIHHQYLIIEIYMIGDNVHGMCLIVVFAIEKVLVLIGGMPITGIICRLEMGIVLMVTQQ